MLRRLPVSSEVLGPPKGFYPITRNWLASSNTASAAARVHEFVEGHRIARPRPITVDGRVPWQFDAYYGGSELDDPPGWVLEISQGRVAGNGGVITPDDHLLADVSRELIVADDQSKHSVLHRVALGRPKPLRGSVAVLSVVNAKYWHWFFDLLPRILLLERLPGGLEGIDWFIVNELNYAYQAETLDLLGVPQDKILQSRHDLHIKADRLLVPSVFKEVPARWACQLLRERFAKELDRGKEAKRPRRIYISRSDAKMRRVLNEDALMAHLGAYGFERYTLDGKSVREQYELFASAETVIAPHGAGLTNILFCRIGTPVLELFPPTTVNPCYWTLAANLDLPYYCHIGEGPMLPPPPPGTDHDAWFHSFLDADTRNNRDIRVNTHEVVSLLDRALQPS
jgi:capsular polysaccharide biosynthesis protein